MQLPFQHLASCFLFQAMECYIAGVMPPVENWSAECCMAIRQLIEGKIVTVKLLEGEEGGNVHAVDILLSQGRLYKVGNIWKGRET